MLYRQLRFGVDSAYSAVDALTEATVTTRGEQESDLDVLNAPAVQSNQQPHSQLVASGQPTPVRTDISKSCCETAAQAYSCVLWERRLVSIARRSAAYRGHQRASIASLIDSSTIVSGDGERYDCIEMRTRMTNLDCIISPRLRRRHRVQTLALVVSSGSTRCSHPHPKVNAWFPCSLTRVNV